MSDPHKTPADRLVAAYQRMLEHTHQAIEHAQKETAPAFRDLLHRARDQMVELGELTREEAHKVADYLERDVKDAAHYIADTGESLRTWWRFDVAQVERRMLDLMAGVADRTSLELQGWAEQARRRGVYNTGEIAGPGTLLCTVCHTPLTMIETGRIPACPQCGGTNFHRSTERAAP